MSAFLKNYYSPKDSTLFLSLSWETGYRNVQIHHGDRLVHTIDQPMVLVEGIKIQDEELGTIKIYFTTERPKKLVVKVNNRKFKTVNKTDLGYDYTGLITIFTTLAVLAAMESIIFGRMYEFDFSYPLVAFSFIGGLVIAVIYGVTSYLLSKKKSWSYFMGTSIFSLTTLISIFGISLILSTWANYFILVIRLGMLTFMLFQVKHIMKEIRKTRGSHQDDSLIDS